MAVEFVAVTHDIKVRNAKGSFPVALGLESKVDLSEDNGRMVLRAMGLESEVLCGEVPIAEARRAVILGLNRKVVPTRRRDHGIGERGCVFVVPALSELEVRNRVRRIGQLVEEAAERGATHITWG